MGKTGPAGGDKAAPAKCMGNYENYKGLRSGFPKPHEGNAESDGGAKGVSDNGGGGRDAARKEAGEDDEKGG